MVLAVDVASDTTMVFDSNLEPWPYICSREHHLRKAQIAVLGDTEIQYTSKKSTTATLIVHFSYYRLPSDLCLVLVNLDSLRLWHVLFVSCYETRVPISTSPILTRIELKRNLANYCWSNSIWFNYFFFTISSVYVTMAKGISQQLDWRSYTRCWSERS
jgi:hypothetical protein